MTQYDTSMSNTDTIDTTDARTIRRTIRETLAAADGGVTRDDLLETVTAVADTEERAVADQLDDLERAGFVYLVDEEVKLV